MTRFIARAAILAGAVAAAGCASLAVTDEAIVDRTAFALGLARSDFTVSDRQNEGTTTRYLVRTRAGLEYHCFIGGSFNILGRSVSEAICTRKGEPARQPLQR